MGSRSAGAEEIDDPNMFHPEAWRCCSHNAALRWDFSCSEPARTAAATARHEIAYDPYEGSAQRVIINVTLNGRVKARLAVDTGAPKTVISGALAERLGLLNG